MLRFKSELAFPVRLEALYENMLGSSLAVFRIYSLFINSLMNKTNYLYELMTGKTNLVIENTHKSKKVVIKLHPKLILSPCKPHKRKYEYSRADNAIEATNKQLTNRFILQRYSHVLFIYRLEICINRFTRSNAVAMNKKTNCFKLTASTNDSTTTNTKHTRTIFLIPQQKRSPRLMMIDSGRRLIFN